MRIHLSILLSIFGLLHASDGQISSAQRSYAREQRQKNYLNLQKQIFARPDAPANARELVHSTPPAKVDEITSQLHSLIQAEIEDTLAGPNASAQDVVKSLQDMLGEMSLSNWGKQATNTPFAELLDLNGAKVLAAAYGMLRGSGAIPNSHSYLEFYTSQNGAWQLKAQADLSFDGRTFFVSLVDAGRADQLWFLVSGRMFGDTGGRLKACLYAFDGTTVSKIWKRDNLTWGTVTVSHGTVTLEYDKEYHSSERVRETLDVTPDGLE